MGIVIGSNISNIAIILGLSVFAVPAGQGIILARREARDASLVGSIALAMMLCTALAVAALAWQAVLPRVVLLVCALLTLGLFGVLTLHTLGRVPASSLATEDKTGIPPLDGRATGVRMGGVWWTLTAVVGALGLALGAVVVMVEAGQAIALEVHLPMSLLSLVILAIATSLPNTVVAFTLARTGRASASASKKFSAVIA